MKEPFFYKDLNFVNDVYGLTQEQKIQLIQFGLERKKQEKHLDNEWGQFENITINNNKELEKKVDEVLNNMSLQQKVKQMTADSKIADYLIVMKRYNEVPYYAGEDLELNIPGIKFTDGPTGIVMGNKSTCFPVSIARAATWDVELEEAVGDVIGIEGRAQGANLFAGVCINIVRHPAWGRAQETYGEDTFLTGKMGTSLTRGVQKHMMACAKHYVANSIENSRFKVNVKIDERALREIYLPHFKECVEEGIACIMSAYNKVLGEYCGHNSYVLRDILKEQWGFDGFVISDFIWGARNGEAASKGGLDIEMPIEQIYGKKLIELVENGQVDEEVINDSVRRILRQKIKFSQIGDKSLYKSENICCENNVQLAKKVALNSMVLLKNEENLLPINKEKHKTIAVVGALANEENTGDMKGSSRVYPPYVIKPLEGIQRKVGDNVNVLYCDGKNKDELESICKDSDIVIAIVGLTGYDEGELMTEKSTYGGDRDTLSLKEHDLELLNCIQRNNKNCVVCVQGGSAITMEEWKDNVKAILMMWYPGMEGGSALADILFGDFNPCGKLPITIPNDSSQLPYFNKDASEIVYDYYHGYYLVDKSDYDVAFNFGYGLSYSKYKYSNVRVNKSHFSSDEEITVSVDLKNTGEYAGSEIIQVYVGLKNSKVIRHVKELKGFRKVYLKPNEKQSIDINISVKNLAYYNENEGKWDVEGGEYIIYVGASSKNSDLLAKRIIIE